MKRILAAVLGGHLEPRLTWVMVTIGTNFTALAALTVYAGPWLLRDEGLSLNHVSIALSAAGIAGVCGALAAGKVVGICDLRRLATAIAFIQVISTAVMSLPVGRVTTIGALVCTMAVQPLRGVAQRTLVTRAELGEKGFAEYRLVLYLGSFAGPVAAGVLVGWGWQSLRIGVTVMYGLSFLSALRLEPSGPLSASGATADSAGGRTRSLLRDTRLWLLVLGSTAGWTIIYMFETVLPTVAVGSGAIGARSWGLVYAVGPLLVLFLQLRIHRGLQRIPVTARLTSGAAVMGLAFAVFFVKFDIAAFLIFVIILVLGDMVWGPASDDLVVRAAPANMLGEYLGTTTATMWAGGAIAPVIGFPIRQAAGNYALWLTCALLAAFSASCYYLASRRITSESYRGNWRAPGRTPEILMTPKRREI